MRAKAADHADSPRATAPSVGQPSTAHPPGVETASPPHRGQRTDLESWECSKVPPCSVLRVKCRLLREVCQSRGRASFKTAPLQTDRSEGVWQTPLREMRGAN